jgi:hypothetical protein
VVPKEVAALGPRALLDPKVARLRLRPPTRLLQLQILGAGLLRALGPLVEQQGITAAEPWFRIEPA